MRLNYLPIENPDGENDDPDGIGNSRDLTLDPLLIYSAFSDLIEEDIKEIIPGNANTIQNLRYSIRDIIDQIFFSNVIYLLQAFKQQEIKPITVLDWTRLFIAILLTNPYHETIIHSLISGYSDLNLRYDLLKKIISIAQQHEFGLKIVANILTNLISTQYPYGLNQNDKQQLIQLILQKYLSPNSYDPIQFLQLFRAIKF